MARPIPQLKDLTFDNMKNIEIKFFVRGRISGRRFTLNYNNQISDQITLKDIFKKVQKIAKKESNIENLQEAKAFLKKLKKAEKDAIVEYKSMGTGYKILTWFCRIFTFGSHLENIKVLKKKIEDQLNDLNFDKNMQDIELISWNRGKNELLQNLALRYVETNNLDLAFRTIEEIRGYNERDTLLTKLAEAYLQKNDPNYAFKSVNALSSDPRFGIDQEEKDVLLEKIGNLYLSNGDLEEIAQIVENLNSISKKSNLCFSLAKAYLNKNELENALGAINGINCQGKLSILDEISKSYEARGDVANAERLKQIIVEEVDSIFT